MNRLGDVFAKGIEQSAGTMVNYRYKPDHIEASQEAHTGAGRGAAHPPVKKRGRK